MPAYENVMRFDIEVDQPTGVGVADGVTDLPEDAQQSEGRVLRYVLRHRALDLAQHGSEGLSFSQLHGEEKAGFAGQAELVEQL